MSVCKSCGKEIKFIKLKTGKWNPVDPILRSLILSDDGPETIITPQGDVVRGRFAAFEDGANRSGYISHFATCPFANSHRRRD